MADRERLERLERMAEMGDVDAVDELIREQYRSGLIDEWGMRALELQWSIRDGKVSWHLDENVGVTYAEMQSRTMKWIVFDSIDSAWEYATGLLELYIEGNRFEIFLDDESVAPYAYVPHDTIEVLAREAAESRFENMMIRYHPDVTRIFLDAGIMDEYHDLLRRHNEDRSGTWEEVLDSNDAFLNERRELEERARNLLIDSFSNEEAYQLENDLSAWLEKEGFTRLPEFVEVDWDSIPYRDIAEQTIAHHESPATQIFSSHGTSRNARSTIKLRHGVAYRIE